MDKLYTIAEVATKLNLSDKTLRRWEDAGRFHPTRTLGNQRRYSLEDLQILDAIKHDTIPDQDDLLTITQAAAFCGVSSVTIGRWENAGKIHPFITANNTYYPRHKLIEKLAELKASAPEQNSTPVMTELEETPDEHASIPTPTHDDTPHPKPHLAPLEKPIEKTDTAVLKPYFINFLVMLILIMSYHILVSITTPKSPTPQLAQNTVGSSTTDPAMDLLKKYLDPTGSLITPTLTLSPGSTPTTPNPGTLYYDADAQTLKVYRNGSWSDLGSTQTLKIGDASLIAGSSTLPRGKNLITVSNDKILTTSLVTASFTSDYSPAKKYWITQTPGSFTLHTDFPMTAPASFNYIIVSSPVATQSATPSATIR